MLGVNAGSKNYREQGLTPSAPGTPTVPATSLAGTVFLFTSPLGTKTVSQNCKMFLNYGTIVANRCCRAHKDFSRLSAEFQRCYGGQTTNLKGVL
jgi:hypothetical protein